MLDGFNDGSGWCVEEGLLLTWGSLSMVEGVSRRGGMCLDCLCDARREKWWLVAE